MRGYPEREFQNADSAAELLRPWIQELMDLHGVDQHLQGELLKFLNSLPKSSELNTVLQGNEPHNYKLGYTAAMILNWRDQGLLGQEFWPFAEAISQTAKRLNIEE